MNQQNEVFISSPEASEIQSGPIRHPSLSPELLERIKLSHDVVGKYLGVNLEQWEIGFMRDAHPEPEIAIWNSIALIFTRYQGTTAKLSKRDGKDVIASLLMISMGCRDTHQFKVPSVVGKKLLRLWDDAAKEFGLPKC